MKGTIVDSHVDGDITYVTKQTKYGTFTSKVTLNPEDKDIQSQLLGYTFAEIKCDIQALKVKAKYFEQRALGIKHAYDVMRKSGVDIDDPVMLKLYRQLMVAWDNYYDQYEIYQINKDSYYDRVARMLDYRRKIRKN